MSFPAGCAEAAARPGMGVASTSCGRPLLTAGTETGTTALTGDEVT